MKCAVVRTTRYENGQVKSMSAEVRELNTVQAENVSELATVVVLDSASIGGMATVYEDRATRQALVDVRALESFALECERRRLSRGERGELLS